jgi:hypothetical protein
MTKMGAVVAVTLVAASLGLVAAFISQAEEHAPVANRWVCTWDPTINRDWHDDYLCTNGDKSDRPHLIPGDSFVDQAEIEQAAAEYEARLNS